jgi:acyl phosphate:glycerol-3-phosphate acyltransferase
VTTPAPSDRPEPVPLHSKHFLAEARRKLIHLSFLVLPLWMLHPLDVWPRGRSDFRNLLIVLVAGAIVIDLVRLHAPGVRLAFRRFFGEMIREHEELSLLGSTYLLLAALLAIEIFPQPVAAAALGFTVLGDAFAAIAGKAWGRTRLFHKTLEGALAGLAACLVWAAFIGAGGYLPWTPLLLGALAASLIELLPIPLDDNLGITLFSGYVMKLLWMSGTS